MKATGIKSAVSEANKCNAWAIVYDSNRNHVYAMELVSNSDEPAIGAGEYLVIKSNAYRRKTTMAEVASAINEISYEFVGEAKEMSDDKAYELVREDGGRATTMMLLNSREACLGELERIALYIADTYDAECKEWIDSLSHLDYLIEDSRSQGAENWVKQYEGVKADFVPGLWRTDINAEPELIYAKGNDRLEYDGVVYEVKEHYGDDRKRIGRRLQQLRAAKGMSQADLANACGISKTNISKIENGRYNVSIDILAKIAGALGCRIDFE